jgi:hypothetical protein
MLNEKNFLEFAVKSYRNPRCLDLEEFLEDLARIKYVKRLLNRYIKNDVLQERLIINHLMSIYNVFDIACANEMLFYRCDEKTWPALRSFLAFLNYLPREQILDNEFDEIIMKKLKML